MSLSRSFRAPDNVLLPLLSQPDQSRPGSPRRRSYLHDARADQEVVSRQGVRVYRRAPAHAGSILARFHPVERVIGASFPHLRPKVCGYAAVALFGVEVWSGGLAFGGGSVAGLTNVLPSGPACTASCSALPPASCCHDRNQSVQPLSQTPARGLPVIVTGSPG